MGLTPYTRAALVVLFGWLAATAYTTQRYGDEPGVIHREPRPWNGEVARHFLNILGSYRADTVAQHVFAPTVPCARGPDAPCIASAAADAPGSAVVTSPRLGRAVYTSFPPGAMVLVAPFVLPAADAFGVPPLAWLRGLNQCIGLLTALLFLRVLDRVLAADLPRRTLVLLAATVPLVLSVEVLHSHHVSMWSHQVMQPVFAVAALLALDPMRLPRVLALGALCALACWIEWSAFLLGAALAGVVWWRSPRERRHANGAAFIAVFALGGLSLLAYYAWLVGLDGYLRALGERFVDRSIANPTYGAAHWLLTLLQSFVPSLVFVLVLGVRALAAPVRRATANLRPDTRWPVLAAVCAVPLFENVLLFQHTIIYSFDRLKWAFLLALAIAFLGERLLAARDATAPVLLGAGAAVCGAAGVWHLTVFYVPYW